MIMRGIFANAEIDTGKVTCEFGLTNKELNFFGAFQQDIVCFRFDRCGFCVHDFSWWAG